MMAPPPKIAAQEKPRYTAEELARSFTSGRLLTLLSKNGSSCECIASLDSKLTALALRFSPHSGAEDSLIDLQKIERICIGEDAGDDIIASLDELCVTLLVENGDVYSFRFDDVDERDTFAFCLTMFIVDAPSVNDFLLPNRKL